MKALLLSLFLSYFIIFLFGLAAQSAPEKTYRDPEGRFTVISPAEWGTESLGSEGVKRGSEQG